MVEALKNIQKNTSNKFIVVETTEFVKELLKLKANLFGLSINDYISRLITGQKVNKRSCPSCKKDMFVDYFNDEHSFIANDKEYIVKLKNIPYQKCENCELEIGVEISKITEMFILRSFNLNRGKSVLKEIDFKKIL